MKPIFHRGRPNRRCRKAIKFWNRHRYIRIGTTDKATMADGRVIQGQFAIYRDRGPCREELAVMAWRRRRFTVQGVIRYSITIPLETP